MVLAGRIISGLGLGLILALLVASNVVPEFAGAVMPGAMLLVLVGGGLWTAGRITEGRRTNLP